MIHLWVIYIKLNFSILLAIPEGLQRPDVQNYIKELINNTQQMCNSQVIVLYVVEYVIVPWHLNLFRFYSKSH